MYYILTGLICAFAPFAGICDDCIPGQIQHIEIDTDTLTYWYQIKKPMVIVDARSEPYFDGFLLPNAIWLPCESDEAAIEAALPSKECCVVVYCHGEGCPASGLLYDKLSALGYCVIYEYHEGIDAWTERELPTEDWYSYP